MEVNATATATTEAASNVTRQRSETERINGIGGRMSVFGTCRMTISLPTATERLLRTATAPERVNAGAEAPTSWNRSPSGRT